MTIRKFKKAYISKKKGARQETAVERDSKKIFSRNEIIQAAKPQTSINWSCHSDGKVAGWG